MKTLARVALAAAFLAVVALPASAQVYTGRIDVTVADGTGAVLPGATVAMTGILTKTQGTDSRGEAHFLSLPPGRYMIVVKLSGFGDYKNDNVPVGAGLTVPLRITLTVGAVATSVDVIATTPILDTKKIVTSTTVALDELQNIPSSRDPWVVLQTVPGIAVDRVNVGGAESGQQSVYQAKGAAGGDNTWNMDGIAITDMAALGSTPTYYDFDMFQEMNVTTGGADVTLATPGIALNFVLRSGTNKWRGSGRDYFEGKNLYQSSNVPTNLFGQLVGYNRINTLKDYGVEGGGPLVRNRIFIQASAGETHPKLDIFTRCSVIAASLFAASGCPDTKAIHYGVSGHDETILQDYSFKGSGELNHDTRLSFTYFKGDKKKFGRGAGPTHPDETTWNQKGPTSLYKVEVNRTLANNLFVSVRYAHLSGGFSLTPRGGLDTPAYVDASGVWHGSYVNYATKRPQDTVSGDGNYFRGSHEFKFGFGYRKAAVTSSTTWPGGGIITFQQPGGGSLGAAIVRPHHIDVSTVYMNGYFGDSWAVNGRMTINAGVRWDRQPASLNAMSDPNQPADPLGLLPALTGAAVKSAIVYNSLTPRIGVTYGLDDSRKTILRASYSLFASQINATQAAVVGTVQYGYTYYYNITDANGNGTAEASEIKATGVFGGSSGVNVKNPGALETPNKIGKYNTPLTHEIIIGVDRQVLKDFAIGMSYTYRRSTKFNWNHRTDIDGNDYTAGGTYNCAANETAILGACSVTFFRLDPTANANSTGNTFEARPGYRQRYAGVEAYAVKRLSHNWTARAGWSTNRHREYFPSLSSRMDPTSVVQASAICPQCGPNLDGGTVITPTGGSGKSNIFVILPKYQFIFNTAYTAKYGITMGVNYLYRKGYAMPYFHSGVQTGDPGQGSKSILLVSATDGFLLPDVHSLDMRIGKFLRLNRTVVLNFDLDAFNILNLGTILGRQYNLASGSANQALEIMNPRIIRFGVRVGFN